MKLLFFDGLSIKELIFHNREFINDPVAVCFLLIGIGLLIIIFAIIGHFEGKIKQLSLPARILLSLIGLFLFFWGLTLYRANSQENKNDKTERGEVIPNNPVRSELALTPTPAQTTTPTPRITQTTIPPRRPTLNSSTLRLTANNDRYYLRALSSTVRIPVLSNDRVGSGITLGRKIIITQHPTRGRAKIYQSDIEYTPNLEDIGSDEIKYVFTNRGSASNPTTVSIFDQRPKRIIKGIISTWTEGDNKDLRDPVTIKILHNSIELYSSGEIWTDQKWNKRTKNPDINFTLSKPHPINANQNLKFLVGKNLNSSERSVRGWDFSVRVEAILGDNSKCELLSRTDHVKIGDGEPRFFEWDLIVSNCRR